MPPTRPIAATSSCLSVLKTVIFPDALFAMTVLLETSALRDEEHDDDECDGVLEDARGEAHLERLAAGGLELAEVDVGALPYEADAEDPAHHVAHEVQRVRTLGAEPAQ